MSRKVTWSILLLLLTSVQSFAMVCNVRCALMSAPAKATATDSAMQGMEHCDMPSAPAKNGPAAQALQVRSGTTCCDDLSFAKDPGTAEQTDISLHAFDHASLTELVTSPVSLQKHERPPSRSDAVPPSNRTTLISNLRI
ncbi:MAG TPA: hypothetical protein VIX42_03785 [Edaphobacter sp.]